MGRWPAGGNHHHQPGAVGHGQLEGGSGHVDAGVASCFCEGVALRAVAEEAPESALDLADAETGQLQGANIRGAQTFANTFIKTRATYVLVRIESAPPAPRSLADAPGAARASARQWGSDRWSRISRARNTIT